MGGRSTLVACGCGGEMHVLTNGVVWVERYEDGSPYKLWAGDLCQCKSCDNKAVSLAGQPYAHECEEGFEKTLENANKHELIVGKDYA